MNPRVRRHLATALVAGFLLAALSCSSDSGQPGPREEPADATVVVNADVDTLDAEGTRAEAFAYDADGVIIAVGTEGHVRAAAGEEADVVDARGNFVLPGFQDAHVHVPEAGINAGLCLLDPGLSLADYELELEVCLEEQPGDGWLRAAGASLFDLRATAELPIDVLDRVAPDRPALVLDDIGHSVWANSVALQGAGIGLDAEDPPGGVYHRDPASGRMTGLLLENAQNQVRDAAAVDADVAYEGLLVALGELARNGITSISDAGGYWPQGHPAAWVRALEAGTLTVRASNGLYLYPDKPFDEQLAEFADLYANDPESLLRFNTAKIYVDGVLDLGTASLLTPYDRAPDPDFPSGFPYFDQAELEAYGVALAGMGFDLSFHVIGDAAARSALDTVEAIRGADPEADGRYRTTHAYLIDPQDVERYVDLEVIADFQMATESITGAYAEYLTEFIGDRAFDLIPTRTLLDAGAHVALSSDWDADELSTLGTIERALTRPDQRVPDLETALRLVTIDAAYALHQEDRTGSIEVGKQADFVILDQDIFAVAADRISETNVLLTAVGGTVVYEDPVLEQQR